MRSFPRSMMIAGALLAFSNFLAQVQSLDASPRPQSESYFRKLEKTNSEMHWQWLSTNPPILSILTNYGPCGTVSELAPTQIAFNTGKESDRTIHLYPTWNAASLAAWQYCGTWYAQGKSNRRAMQEINQAWLKQHPSPKLTDISRSLFTRDGSFGCPTWAAALYAYSARDHGWRYGGQLAGVDDPTSSPPKADQQLSPEYYGCKTFKDGTQVEFINVPAPSGTFIKTSIGWMSSAEELRN
jgi:hypothetical protein